MVLGQPAAGRHVPADVHRHRQERSDRHQVGAGAHDGQAAMPRQQQQHHETGGECCQPKDVV